MKARRVFIALGAWIGGWALLTGQTRVDLGRQARNVDFTAAEVTKPFRSGATLPESCSPGEAFFKIDAPAGKKLHLCVAPNSWGVAGEELPFGGAPGEVLSATDSGPAWRSLGGDVTGAAGGLTVRRIQGHRVSEGQPSEGDVLTWSSIRDQWEPQTAHEAGMGLVVSGKQIGIDGAIVPLYQRGSGNPSGNCVAGRDYYVDTSNEDLYYCAADGWWRAVSKADHQHTTEDLQSGVLGLVRGGTNQANWVAGRCVQVSEDGTRLESASGPCSAGGFDPLDESVIWIREEFPNRSTSSNSIGTHGWQLSCSGGSLQYLTSGTTYNTTYLSAGTSTTTGGVCLIELGYTATNATFIGSLFQYTGWTSVFRFSFNSTSDIYGFVGFKAGTFDSPAFGCGVEFDSTQDTDFMFKCRTSAGETRVSTGVPADTAWHTLRMWTETADAVTLQLDNGTPQTINTNVTSSPVAPIFGVKTLAAASKAVRAYRFLYRGPYVQ